MAGAIAAAALPLLRATPMGIMRKPHQPHYQSRDYNALNGGIERWFEPVTDAVAGHPALNAILRTSHELFDRMTPPAFRPEAWHVELHQFRIEARVGQEGHPTPEGMHRDGVDWVLVLMVKRENIASGKTTIYDLAKHPLGSFTLTQPLELGIGRRQPGFSRRHRRRAARSAASGLSRRARGHLPTRVRTGPTGFATLPVKAGIYGRRGSRLSWGKLVSRCSEKTLTASAAAFKIADRFNAGSLPMSQHHVLRASPETCHWGYFDAGLKPVLNVASGDTVTVDAVSGGPDVLPSRMAASTSSPTISRSIAGLSRSSARTS